MIRGAAVVGVLALALATLTGCGSTPSDDGTIPSNDPATQSVSITPTAPVTSTTPAQTPWFTIRERHSGVRFQVPARVKPKRTTSPLHSWTYTVPDPDNKQLTVAVGVVRYGPTDINSVVSTLVGLARNAGMGDAQGSDIHRTTVDGRAAQAGRITWTQTGGLSAYMTVTTVAAGDFAVIAEVTGTTSGAPQGVARPVKTLTKRLIRGINLP